MKPSVAGERGKGFINEPARLRLINLTLAECIQISYGIQAFQLDFKNLPVDRYDIVASAPNHPGRAFDARYRGMLQAMLADAFNCSSIC